jgi:signal peptidase I
LSIDIKNNTVVVDGKKVDEPYIKEPMVVEGDSEIPSVVPKGKVFVMGDNRNASTDSRFSLVETVSNEDILGKAMYVFFPFYRIKSLSLG